MNDCVPFWKRKRALDALHSVFERVQRDGALAGETLMGFCGARLARAVAGSDEMSFDEIQSCTRQALFAWADWKRNGS